ncbi:MAG: DUF63 family protein [Candidatus Poseidoniales archaeon]|jgi:uncharacterized membrane protein|tara:strand:+ start:4475 stop:5755 length:1281 start_codon:yes stop_codon:yes gene_type:complete
MPNHLEELYDYEKLSINIILATSIIFLIGLFLNFLDFSNPLTDFIYEYYLNPIFDEEFSDAGYNTVNTMTYAFILAMFVVALAAFLRYFDIDSSDYSIIALFPYVLWASFGEVVEDAQMFDSDLAVYFVSPGIHFQTATWVIISGTLAYLIANNSKDNDNLESKLTTFSSILILSHFLIYSWSISNSHTVIDNDINLAPLKIIGLLAVFLPQILQKSMRVFTPIQRVVYVVGIGGSLVFFGALSSYAMSVPSDELTLWPLLVVIGLPSISAYLMYIIGENSAKELYENGLIAGVLPVSMTEEEYINSQSEEKDLIEKLRKRAIGAYPVVFLAVAGQFLDGLATWIGIDYFNYSEKHVLSAWIIDKFDTAAGFTVVKLGLGGLIWYFFTISNFEYRQQHLRLLIGLAMLVVGMAPGLRDVFRLSLGV